MHSHETETARETRSTPPLYALPGEAHRLGITVTPRRNERRDKSTVVKKNWMHKPKKKKRLGIRMTMSIPGDISTGETLRLVYESDEKEKINSIKGGTSRFVSDLSESHTYEGTVRSKEKD